MWRGGEKEEENKKGKKKVDKWANMQRQWMRGSEGRELPLVPWTLELVLFTGKPGRGRNSTKAQCC